MGTHHEGRRLIEASTLEPETLKVLCTAFDEVWAEISHHFDGQRATTLECDWPTRVAKEDRLKDYALEVVNGPLVRRDRCPARR